MEYENENALSTEELETVALEESEETLDADPGESSEESEELENGSEESEGRSLSEFESSVIELLSGMDERLESVESCVVDSSVPISAAEVDSLRVTDGLLLLILLIMISFLIKEWIGGILDSCIRR